MKILIDPGHRNNLYDFGACSNGLKESKLALSIVNKLKVELEKHKIICYLTRSSEEDTIKLVDRTNKAKALNVDLLVSIHINSAGNPNAKGVEVLYKQQKALAEGVCNIICKSTGAVNRGAKQRTDLAILNGFANSILVECGFISNLTESKLLASEAYQDKIVKAITEAVVKKYKIVVEEDVEVVRKVKMQVNGAIREVSSIEKNGENYVRLRDLQDSHIVVTYDRYKNLPVLNIK